MSNSNFQILPETIINQKRASNPTASAFVSANAGSGKTHVLAQRVTRLLLAGHPPSRIMCLTFTKAAAAEMSLRIFKDLRHWASLSDEDLAEILADLEGGPALQGAPGRSLMQRARLLFAQALETPGGLKIQTIHAFCESILHQFPLEAQISGHFEVMDDAMRQSFVEQSRNKVLANAEQNPDSSEAQAIAKILTTTSEFAFNKALDNLIDERQAFRNWIPARATLEQAISDLRASLKLEPTQTRQTLLADYFPLTELDSSTLAQFAKLGFVGSTKMVEQAEIIQKFVEAQDDEDRLKYLQELCLTKDGSPKKPGSFATKAIENELPGLQDKFEREIEKLEQLQDKLTCLTALEMTAALACIGDRILSDFELAKQNQSLLDFDDLVARTAHLLTQTDASQWVQYKLDQGIDHILVDEAQDTSPQQWKIIRSLVDEYFSGEGIRAQTARTIFAVGDEKQSIYSFQGAKPETFSQNRLEIKSLAQGSEKSFFEVPLNQSFRSSLDVLRAVDAVFSDPAHYKGISQTPQPTTHETARGYAPGEVEIWPMVTTQKPVEPDHWTDPMDKLSSTSPEFALATKIADTIENWLIDGNHLRATSKAIMPGDILILVRKRGAFMAQMTRELKRRQIAVAGMDRFKLTDHIAVKDLICLGRFAVLAEDDLSLAALMRSPLLGLSEDDLFEIATCGGSIKGRGELSLFAAFAKHIKTGGTSAQKLAFEKLIRWQTLADQVSVFEFYAQILHADRGRANLLNRLGLEAEDVIDVFLDKCLKSEEQNLPGLDGFLNWLEMSDPTIKREMAEVSNQVRIMTAHGAKGLEAPVVFLIDPGTPASNSTQAPAIYTLAPDIPGKPETLVWQIPGHDKIPAIRTQEEIRKQLAADEYRRLFYVGMTRAADRLIVCGYKKTRSPTDPTWQEMALNALVTNPKFGHSQPSKDEDGNIISWNWKFNPDEQAAQYIGPLDDKTIDNEAISPLCENLRQPAETEGVMQDALAPSNAFSLIDKLDDNDKQVENRLMTELKDSPVLDGTEDNFSLQKGNIIHRLLQGLPAVGINERHKALDLYLKENAKNWRSDQIEQLKEQILQILDMPELEDVFDPSSRAEVPITGKLNLHGKNTMVRGQIDRLAITQDHVKIIDYKTNRFPPTCVEDCPPQYLIQMAIYRQLIEQIYPAKDINCLIIWTQGPNLMYLPAAILDSQLKTDIDDRS